MSTDCKKCVFYQRLGEICPIEHGKEYYWEYCRDFKPLAPEKILVTARGIVKAR